MFESNNGGASRGLVAVCCGAVVAVALAYAVCYVLAGFGLGVVGAPGRSVGPVVFSRAALNLYAMQHVTLLGHGNSVSAAGTAGGVYGTISVPLSLWAAVPAVALVIGGFAAARISRRASWSDMIAWAVPSGIVYGSIMAAGSRIVSARIDSFLMPEFAGFGSNPPEFPFRPSAASAFVFTGIFGVVCSYFGAVLATRRRPGHEPPGKWWACVKAVIVIAAIIQLPIAGYIVFLEVSKSDKQEAEPTGTTGTIELIPTATGLGYSMIHGAGVAAGAESHFKPTGQTRRLLDARLNLYSGITRNDELEKSRRAMPLWLVVVAALMGAAGAFATGAAIGPMGIARRFAADRVADRACPHNISGAADRVLRVLTRQGGRCIDERADRRPGLRDLAALFVFGGPCSISAGSFRGGHKVVRII